jgi:hypothetical protein
MSLGDGAKVSISVVAVDIAVGELAVDNANDVADVVDMYCC